MNEPENEALKLTDSEVTSHTAGMWKYNLCPPDRTEYKNGYLKTPRAEIIAAAVRGKKHKHEGGGRDDWFEFDTVGDICIAAVSDGAGSKPLSGKGAEIICKTVVSSLKTEFAAMEEVSPESREILGRPFDDDEFISLCGSLAVIMRNGVDAAYAAVTDELNRNLENEEIIKTLERAPVLSDYGATMLAAVTAPVKVNGKEEHFILSLQIGDGAIASVDFESDYENALRILSSPDSGEYAGETDFLVSENVRKPDSLIRRTKISRRKISALIMLTDGVADDYFPNSPELLRLCADLKLNGILDSPDKPDAGEYAGKIPKPAEYPWVNDPCVMYAFQYAKAVMKETGLTLRGLWENGGVISAASLNSFGIKHEHEDKSDLLLSWLDNYVERGSFDDRTCLVVVISG